MPLFQKPTYRVFNVDDYGADPTGARVSDQAFAEAYGLALAAVISGNPDGGAQVRTGAGVYQWSPNVVQVKNRMVGFKGPGSQCCTHFTNGSGGDVIWLTDTSGALPGSAPSGGFSVYGWNAGPGTNGVHYGDRLASRLTDVHVYGFNADANSRGFLFRNDNGGLSERCYYQVWANQCSVLYDFDGNNANGSFDYSTHLLGFNQTACTAAAVGYRLINGGHAYGGDTTIRGNASNSNAARTVTCIQIGASAADTARLNGRMSVDIECDASTGPVKDLVVQGASAAAGLISFRGRMVYLNAAGAFTAGAVTAPAIVTGWGTLAGPLFSSHGTLTALGTAAAGLSTYSG